MTKYDRITEKMYVTKLRWTGPLARVFPFSVKLSWIRSSSSFLIFYTSIYTYALQPLQYLLPISRDCEQGELPNVILRTKIVCYLCYFWSFIWSGGQIFGPIIFNLFGPLNSVYGTSWDLTVPRNFHLAHNWICFIFLHSKWIQIKLKLIS